MKVARAGPTGQASLSSRSRERPGTVDRTPTPGRAAVWATAGTLDRMIAVPYAGDPDAAGRALQIEHEVGAVTALAVPHLERWCRTSHRGSGNGSRHARLPGPRHCQIPLLPRCLPALRLERGGDLGAGAGGDASGGLGGGAVPVGLPNEGPKGLSEEGGRDEGGIPGQLLGLLDRQRMQTAQQLDPGVRAQRLPSVPMMMRHGPPGSLDLKA